MKKEYKYISTSDKELKRLGLSINSLLGKISIGGWEIISFSEHPHEDVIKYNMLLSAGEELLANIDFLAKKVINHNSYKSNELFGVTFGLLESGEIEVEYKGQRFWFEDSPYRKANNTKGIEGRSELSESEYIIKVVTDKDFKPTFYNAITDNGNIYIDYEKELEKLLHII